MIGDAIALNPDVKTLKLPNIDFSALFFPNGVYMIKTQPYHS